MLDGLRSKRNIITCFERLFDTYGDEVIEEQFLSGPMMQAIEVSQDNATEWIYGLEEIHASCGIHNIFEAAISSRLIANLAIEQNVPLTLLPENYGIFSLSDLDGAPLAQVALNGLDTASPDLAGYYLGSALHVRTDQRGLGLGAELVISQIADQGALDLWSFGSSSFSPAGLATHKTAFVRLVKMKCDIQENMFDLT